MAQDDLSVISFSIQEVGTVTWEMSEHIRKMLGALHGTEQDALKGRITANVKGFFCTFSACFCIPALAPQMVANVSRALDEASDINIRMLKYL